MGGEAGWRPGPPINPAKQLQRGQGNQPPSRRPLRGFSGVSRRPRNSLTPSPKSRILDSLCDVAPGVCDHGSGPGRKSPDGGDRRRRPPSAGRQHSSEQSQEPNEGKRRNPHPNKVCLESGYSFSPRLFAGTRVVRRFSPASFIRAGLVRSRQERDVNLCSQRQEH